MAHIEYDSNDEARCFVGHDATLLFAAVALAGALRLYARAKIKANTRYTPKNMMAMASRITGKTYKRGEYMKAADDVTTWAREMRAALPHIHREQP